jgi:hypothetical protein
MEQANERAQSLCTKLSRPRRSQSRYRAKVTGKRLPFASILALKGMSKEHVRYVPNCRAIPEVRCRTERPFLFFPAVDLILHRRKLAL